MTATYNPAEVERLVREARQSLDSAFTFARPWAVRERIGTMADQLEVARARIAELEARLRDAAVALEVASRNLPVGLDPDALAVAARLRDVVDG